MAGSGEGHTVAGLVPVKLDDRFGERTVFDGMLFELAVDEALEFLFLLGLRLLGLDLVLEGLLLVCALLQFRRSLRG